MALKQEFPWLAAIYLVPIAFSFAWLGNWPVYAHSLGLSEQERASVEMRRAIDQTNDVVNQVNRLMKHIRNFSDSDVLLLHAEYVGLCFLQAKTRIGLSVGLFSALGRLIFGVLGDWVPKGRGAAQPELSRLSCCKNRSAMRALEVVEVVFLMVLVVEMVE